MIREWVVLHYCRLTTIYKQTCPRHKSCAITREERGDARLDECPEFISKLGDTLIDAISCLEAFTLDFLIAHNI